MELNGFLTFWGIMGDNTVNRENILVQHLTFVCLNIVYKVYLKNRKITEKKT